MGKVKDFLKRIYETYIRVIRQVVKNRHFYSDVKEITYLKETGDLVMVVVKRRKKLHLVINPSLANMIKYRKIVIDSVIDCIKKNKAKVAYIEPVSKVIFNKILEKARKEIGNNVIVRGHGW